MPAADRKGGVGGVGILGGTFNPIHLGHLRAAEGTRRISSRAWASRISSAAPPHKEAEGIAAPHHRWRMVELAAKGNPGLRPWDVELGRLGPSYSIDTVRALRDEIGPDRRIAFILGHDAFAEFHTWKDPEAILSLCDLVVMTRPPWPASRSVHDLCIAGASGFRYDAASGTIRHASGRGVSLQRITGLDISASAIRALVAAGRSIRFLVPATVEAYIAQHGLYRTEGSPA